MSGGKAPSRGPGRGAAAGTETAPPRAEPGTPTVAAGGDAAGSDPAESGAAGTRGPGGRLAAALRRGTRALTTRRVLSQVALIFGFVAAGVIVTWPTARNLADGQLIKVPDISSYVWALWWMAHQVAHLGDPWFTTYMAAPVGVQLGFDTLMPLPGLIMTPVTLLFGPAASFAVLTIAMPGLLCYVTYRAARLWLGQPGSIAAGAFFGLSTMLTWQDLYHLNIAIGTLFLPLTLEAAVRLRRRPGRRQGIILGLVLGGSVLTNQESAVVAALLAAAILLPWLVGLARPERQAAGATDPGPGDPGHGDPGPGDPGPGDPGPGDPGQDSPGQGDSGQGGPDPGQDNLGPGKPADGPTPAPADQPGRPGWRQRQAAAFSALRRRFAQRPRPALRPRPRFALRPRLAFRHLRSPGHRAALRTLALAAVVAVAVASPQLFAMIRQVAEGGAAVGAQQLTETYREYGAGLPTLFAPSPRLGHFQVGTYHLSRLAAAYHFDEPSEGVPTFGVILAGLAVAGLALTWRRRQSWWLALLWATGAALALGPTVQIGTVTHVPLADRWHGVTVSLLMPYTWLVRVPGLSALREADRLALLGLLGAALLAGTAVHWLTQHARPVIAAAVLVVIVAAGALEAGWSAGSAKTMPATMPSVDAAIAADPSHSIVVDVPFGLRGGVGLTGFKMQPESLVLATDDGHPRAISYSSWVPQPTRTGILKDPFYRCLYGAQNGHRHACEAAQVAQALASLRHGSRKIGWVIVWHSRKHAARPSVINYLRATGFYIDYRVNTPDAGISVWHRG
jgi:hypothetical protein